MILHDLKECEMRQSPFDKRAQRKDVKVQRRYSKATEGDKK